MFETRQIFGEELRDDILQIRESVKKISLGYLVERTAIYISYMTMCENDNKTSQSPDYLVVRDLLSETIGIMVDELNEREKRYLGLE